MLLVNMFTLLIYFPEHLNTSGDSQSLEDIEYFIQSATSYFSASEKCLQVYHKKQAEDPIIKTVISYCQTG